MIAFACANVFVFRRLNGGIMWKERQRTNLLLKWLCSHRDGVRSYGSPGMAVLDILGSPVL